MILSVFIDITAVTAVMVFFLGAMVGSFLNVCIVRVPNGKSVLRPPSHCPKCKNAIRYYDNIPIISYFILSGRCRSCGERVSPRYLFVEVLTGSLTAALYFQFGLSLAFLVAFVFVAALIVISFIDLDAWIIPNSISLPGIVLGFLLSVGAQFWSVEGLALIPTPLNSFLGILAGYGFLWTVGWIYERCTGIEGMGGGDMKLLAMFGAFLGWQSIPFTMFFGSLAGSVVGLGIMIGTGAGRRLRLPFGPFLCLGAIIHLFFGREITAVYLGLTR
jgi:leader peptidase (prepilin peptidase)/N-methyltransferase